MVDRTIVGLVGMPGVGKFHVAEAFEREGFYPIEMSAEVKHVLRKQGEKITAEGMKRVSTSLRSSGGDAAIAELVSRRINGNSRSRILVDGIRSQHEVENFRRYFRNFSLVYCFAPKKKRHERILRKAKIAKTQRDIDVLDNTSIDLGIGNAAVFADFVLDLSRDQGDWVRDQVLEIIEAVV